ncbi:MAG: DNRLRE domain-containing protein [Phycisphaerales bacterium]|nr:MAG: DNRLRE domain-containing protein [Phycisphaerales bacterium]
MSFTHTTCNWRSVLIASIVLGTLQPADLRAEEYELIICPSKDAFVDSKNEYTNYGTFPELFTGECEWMDMNYLGHGRTKTFLEFDLSEIPAKSSLIDVKLKMYCFDDGNPSIPREIRVNWVYNWWSETGINFNNAPISYHISSDEITTVGPGKWYVWDNEVIFWDVYLSYHGGPWGNPAPISWAVTEEYNPLEAFLLHRFYSKEDPDPSMHPRLVVTYEGNTAPQTHDDCDGKGAMAVSEGKFPFFTDDATFDGPGLCMTSPNVWYKYTPSRSGVACLSLCGSGYDTKLAVYASGSCDLSSNDLLACDDDYCGCDENGQQCLDSQTKLRVVEGLEYLVEVGGSTSQDTGPGLLTINCCEIEYQPGDIAEGEGVTPNEYIDNYNGGCQSPEMAVAPINCEDTIAGLTGNFYRAGAPVRDTDWYHIDHFGGDLTWTAAAECPIEIVIYDAKDPLWLCANPAEIPQVRATAEPCQTASVTWEDAPEGPYWLLIAPWDIWKGDDIAGWPNDCKYRATLGCSFEENFDSYQAGSKLAGQGGWEAWDGDPAAGDFFVTSDQSQSPPNSVVIDDFDDAVHQHSARTSGKWEYTAWVYVPEEMDGLQYFILLNTYPAYYETPERWSLQLELDGEAGVVEDYLGSDTVPLVRDQWAEIRVVIDLDSDSQSVYYNGQHVVTKGWTDGVKPGGALNIAAVDLYSHGATAVYYDDMALREYVSSCPADVNSDLTVDINDLFQVLAAWGTCNECPEDVNVDGTVDINDLFEVLSAWGPCP